MLVMRNAPNRFKDVACKIIIIIIISTEIVFWFFLDESIAWKGRSYMITGCLTENGYFQMQCMKYSVIFLNRIFYRKKKKLCFFCFLGMDQLFTTIRFNSTFKFLLHIVRVPKLSKLIPQTTSLRFIWGTLDYRNIRLVTETHAIIFLTSDIYTQACFWVTEVWIKAIKNWLTSQTE